MRNDAFRIVVSDHEYYLAPLTAGELKRAVIFFDKYSGAQRSGDLELLSEVSKQGCEFFLETVAACIRRADPSTSISTETLENNLTFHEVMTLFNELCRLDTDRREAIQRGGRVN